jgi:pimeloyl-ACP methyl ester carboxylesterase
VKHIYCISGLGADHRVFSKIKCPGYELHYIKWLIPLKNEFISDYSKRLIHQVHHPEPILIGVSFGGLMCIEIAKHIKTTALILISAIKHEKELPIWMKMAGRVKLNKVVPLHSSRLLEPIENYRLGLETLEEKQMVNDYRKHADQRFVDWAINAVLNWKNKEVPANTFHIHGSTDKIFPLKRIKADCIISGGGHMMVMNRGGEVSGCINNILEQLV